MSSHQSDSAVQRQAEHIIRDKAADVLGTSLEERIVSFDSGATVKVDGVASDESVFVEIFARQGKLKPGQQKKVAQDCLKLITLGRSRPNARLVLAFADDDAAAYATRGTWLAQALAMWGVTVLVVEVDDEVRAGIREAQVKQEMVNPRGPHPPSSAEDADAAASS